jgi:integrator complex subunit 11
MSFSAHADAKGIMQLIQYCEPQNVLLVHGEGVKMEFLKQKIQQEYGIDCYMPANGESAYIPCKPVVPVDVSLSLLKKEMALYDTVGAPDPKRPCRMHGVLVMKDNVSVLVFSYTFCLHFYSFFDHRSSSLWNPSRHSVN